jgi:KDEL-tailed cysteine endopeptidase
MLKAPASFDWRSRGAISPIRDQGDCGSCWAFTAVAALEAHIKIHKRVTVRLSEQMLVDCSPNDGCNKGRIDTAYDYIKVSCFFLHNILVLLKKFICFIEKWYCWQ